MRIPIVVEKTDTGYSAYSPDLEGCVATGTTRVEVERGMREALAFHVQGMKAEGLAVPAFRSYITYVEVAA
ncbi:MAG: type II toxin-antitoxin system HicB family antitoxin [Gemmatimonadetes bacterium]|nr:type II toxin-antitoxin system HicB family antitoxin [Gemmatimonadota bacterium]